MLFNSTISPEPLELVKVLMQNKELHHLRLVEELLSLFTKVFTRRNIYIL
jgi:hypothetical protein